ncbi:MAG: YkgJ family cysteine cluster protein [Nanoarchaeota archaeon]|nr:MAG: YkgJ family cysteine cluster protein [Nanoarchaeota archaeon]
MYSGVVDVEGREVRWETTFDESIKFKCTNCGYCCTSSNVEISKDEILGIKGLGKKSFTEEFVNEEHENSTRIKNTDKDPCLFLNEKKLCNVYEHRPSVCRLYPFKLVPVSDGLVKIDTTYSCKSMLTKHFSKENEVDFGEIVKTFLSHPFGKHQQYQSGILHEAVKEHLDKDSATSQCWESIISEIHSMELFEQTWDLMSSFEKTREQKEILKKSDAHEYISRALEHYKSNKLPINPSYSDDFFYGSHQRPYQSMDLSTNKVYYFRIKEGNVIFIDGKNEKNYPLESITKKSLSPEAKDFLADYLRKLWGRQLTKQKIEQKVYESRGTIPSFSIQLDVAKKKFMLLGFFMDAIAHNREDNLITMKDAQEAVLPFDLIFCYLR